MIYIPFILIISRAMISRHYCRHGLNRYAQSASTFSTKFCKCLNVKLKIVVPVAEENYSFTSSHGRIKSKLFSTFILHKGGQNARCSNQAFTLILTKLFQIMIIGLELLHYQRKRGESVGKECYFRELPRLPTIRAQPKYITINAQFQELLEIYHR